METIPNRREAIILRIVSQPRPDHVFGQQIRREYERLTGEQFPHGSLYVTLSRMEDKGFIRSECVGDDRRVKCYSTTTKGLYIVHAVANLFES